MKIKKILLNMTGLLLLCLVAAAGTMPASAQPAQDTTTRLIVKFKPIATAANAGNVAMPLAATQMQGLSIAAGMSLGYVRPMSGGAHVVSLPGAMTNAEAANVAASIMRNSANIEYAEPDVRMYPMQVPNDPLYANQWHYDISANHGMNLPGAWDITTGNGTTVAAVLDTGIVPHVDNATGMLSGYDMIADINVSNDGDGRDPDPSDPGDWCGGGTSSWHGTHVAGTVGANTNNNVGVAGVNWNTKILPVRVLGTCGGWSSDAADAIVWASGGTVPGVPANANPADVINMSLGGNGACGATYQSAINTAIGNGTTVVVSAGNSNADAANFQPASCTGVITVAAHNNTSNRAYYSNYGATVEIMAPGGERFVINDPAAVLSTLNSGTTTPVPGGDIYVYYDGTSMAAPHVTGLVTLMKAVNPTLTPAQISTAIQDSARAFVPGGWCALNPGMCGAGIADAYSAVAMVAPVADPTALAGSVASSSQIDLTWTDNANNETGYQVERKTGVGGLYAQIASLAANTTSYSDTAAVAEADHFYRVRASSAYAVSAYSTEANLIAPAAPTALATTAVAKTQIDLGWTDNSAVETGFSIERKVVGSGAFTQIGTVAANVVVYSDVTVSAGVSYIYRVRAYTAQGNSSYSNRVTVTRGVAAGGGGGCSLAIDAGLDPLLPLLVLFAAGFLLRRREGNASA